MHDHPHEAARSQQGIDSLECPFVDALGDIPGQILEKHAVLVLKKHLREFMPFERAEEKQAHQAGVAATMDAIARD